MGLQFYDMDDPTQLALPFPAQSQTTSGTVNDVFTEVRSMTFSDKIMITITQNGRLGQWVSQSVADIPAN